MIKKFDDFVNEKLHGSNSPRPSIDLRGESGNAYVILGMAQNLTKQLSKADPEKYDWVKIQSEMTSGDYKHLVNTFEEYFGDYVDIYNADVIDESVNFNTNPHGISKGMSWEAELWDILETKYKMNNDDVVELLSKEEIFVQKRYEEGGKPNEIADELWKMNKD